MRILLFSGKGGVGKTTLAAATGLKLASLGYSTIVMSVDPAHSLADAFDLEGELFHGRTADPFKVADRLDIQELSIEKEVKRHWKYVSSYMTSILQTTGMGEIEAEELAILPGMEELSALMYVNEYRRKRIYDVVVLDCAPTAESMRFVSMPATIDWYMKHLFPVQRNVLKAVRPLANRISPVELPPDTYFSNLQHLFDRLNGINEVLDDPKVTSVRLATNPEKMVLRETQRAFLYFSLNGLTVDTIIVNRILPPEAANDFFAGWLDSQRRVLEEINSYFAPVRIKQIPLLANSVGGIATLQRIGDLLYPQGEDPAAIVRSETPYHFEKVNGKYRIRITLPFATKGEIGLFKKHGELVIQVGTVRRHVPLPSMLDGLSPQRATFEKNTLLVDLV